MLTKVKIIDNSGGIEARIIKILNKKSKLNIGVVVLVSVLSNIAHSKVRKGQMYKGILVSDKSKAFSYLFFGKKAIVLIKVKNDEITPVGTRIKGFISSKLKNILGTNRVFGISSRTI
jgi:large subunit ribosomal protein L14